MPPALRVSRGGARRPHGLARTLHHSVSDRLTSMRKCPQSLVDNSPPGDGMSYHRRSCSEIWKRVSISNWGSAITGVHHTNTQLISPIKSKFSSIFTIVAIDSESAKWVDWRQIAAIDDCANSCPLFIHKLKYHTCSSRELRSITPIHRLIHKSSKSYPRGLKTGR
jgi:hypothetical protein